MSRKLDLRSRSTIAVLLLLACSSAQAEPFQTIIENGNSQNRVDIAILGDGYTAAETQKYRDDVQSFMAAFFNEEPFKEYQRYFNVHRIDVVSNQTGADHPERSAFVDTAFDATYNCSGIQRLICVDSNKVNNVVSNTLGADQHDVTLIIVNDTEYGGSGGSVAVASINASAVELIRHEEGHSFGLLADEYGGPAPPACNNTFEPAAANATKETQRTNIKWNAWIEPTTPVPTTGTTNGVPGLYQGAVYCDAGLYRPTVNSKMRSLDRPYEQINSEQLIRRIYNYVSPIDSSAPAATDITLNPGQKQLFAVTTPLLFTQNLTTKWFVDGQQQATTATFTLDSANLAPGNHVVRLVVNDPTTMVRSDLNQVLAAQKMWNLTVNSTGTRTVLANISTRLRVKTGDNVLIGGFIVTGTQPKKVILRAIGPSLPVAGRLQNPTLELRDSSGGLIHANDDWRTEQESKIINTKIPPSNDLESAIVETLPANNSAYTAIVRGKNDRTGVGLVEVYDLDSAANSRLANVSTRGFVGTNDNVMVGGTIVTGSSSASVVVRAVGPSLSSAGVQNTLADPTLELRGVNGDLVSASDNWQEDGAQAAILTSKGLAPKHQLESAIFVSLSPASYTAIVRGKNNSTGVAVVEAYQLP